MTATLGMFVWYHSRRQQFRGNLQGVDGRNSFGKEDDNRADEMAG